MIREWLARKGFTPEEAEAIWQRAMELQFQAEQQDTRWSPDEVKKRGGDAGIPREYIEQAIQQLQAARQWKRRAVVIGAAVVTIILLAFLFSSLLEERKKSQEEARWQRAAEEQARLLEQKQRKEQEELRRQEALRERQFRDALAQEGVRSVDISNPAAPPPSTAGRKKESLLCTTLLA